ncbi:hypothetical protein J437_LFUL014903 [Ladona fulva]|uniref:Origin recognition complex subunit 2 winged-helix domain-containing protein n=1 Tax=Ladona fulva TaxID=123851 RepID=A0A8K0P5Z3_LADFU|nr:hypothetical protein J437_LFUL014903 [Ladona fulva]
MVKQSGALALSSLKSIAFRDLYWKSREAFLLSSDLALRAQLTEFLDHHMVKSRIGADGDERLTIPIDNSILQDFLDGNEAT